MPASRKEPDAPPGLSSNYFHDSINETDILDVKAPGGHFYMDTTKHTPVVLIGGGVGITPVMSMLNQICESGSTREVWFFYGVNNGSEHIMREHLERMASEHENVTLQICYSRARDEDVLGKDYHHAERVSVDLFKRVLPSSNYDYYMCGPGPMMSSVVEGLIEWGVPEKNIHFEAFGPATVQKAAPDKPPPVGTEFVSGDPVAVDGKKLSPAELLGVLNTLGGGNGIGREDIVENRFVGMKSRGVYETPGGTILFKARRAMESITLDRAAMHLKDEMMPRYAETVYNGFWFSPEREMMQAAIDKASENVTGTVRLKLYKGNVMVTGRKSPVSLYSQETATFEADSVFDQRDSEGFIKLNALRLRLARMIRD